MEVNKVSSWDDVLSDNYNAPPVEQEVIAEEQEAVVETPQEEVVVTDEVVPTEQVTDQVTEQVEQPVVKENLQVETNVGLDEDALYEYLQIKRTNYNEISDLDIVSGFISNDHPSWDESDVEFELEQKYGSALFQEKINLDDIDKEIYPDEYKEALSLNKEIDKAQKLLRRDALEKRNELEEIKNNIQLPTSASKKGDDSLVETKATEEVSQKLSQEDLEKLQKEWEAVVEKDVPSVNEFKFKLGDEEVSYKITDDEQKQMVDKMKQFNAESFLVERGWLKADGTPNVKKITEDVYILENTEKMLKSSWTQAKEKAKIDIIGKDIKNINLGSTNETVDLKANNPYGFGDYVLSL